MPPRNHELFNAQAQPIHWRHNTDTTATMHCHCGFIRQFYNLCHWRHHTHALLHVVARRLTAAASADWPVTLCCKSTIPATRTANTQQAAFARCICSFAQYCAAVVWHQPCCNPYHAEAATAWSSTVPRGCKQHAWGSKWNNSNSTHEQQFSIKTSHVVKPWRDPRRLTTICCVPSPNTTLLERTNPSQTRNESESHSPCVAFAQLPATHTAYATYLCMPSLQHHQSTL